MKAVLISIQPKWCELIASGEKMVEVRKTKPKIETPFKCYIYETKGKLRWRNKCQDTDCERPYPNSACFEGQGKVIGEFVCNRIDYVGWISTPAKLDWKNHYNKDSCLTENQLYDYSNGGCYYEWHISDLVIYDTPRALRGFYHYCGDDPNCDGCELLYYSNTECGKEEFCCSNMYGCKPLKRPPQSWCYVEEVEDEQREAD